MNLHTFYRLLSPKFRQDRMRLFFESIQPTSSTRLLDVGGSPWFWRETGCPARVAVLNMSYPADLDPRQWQCPLIRGDGGCLPFADQSFEVVFSNSVIEHVSTRENQVRFAREIRRVGARVWVQTPARWFWMEPHLVTPLVHYLPKRWQRHLLRFFTVWGWMTRPDQAAVDGFLAEVRLLTFREMQQLFPDCRIHREKFLGLTKSFIAIR